MAKAIPVDFFCKVRYLSHLSVREGAYYWIEATADRDENTYKADLWRQLPGGKPQRLTSSGDVRDYLLTDEGVVFASLRLPKDKETAKAGVPLTVYQRLPYAGGEAEEFARFPMRIGMMKKTAAGYLLLAEYDHRWEAALKKTKGDAKAAAAALREEDEVVTTLDELPFWFNGQGMINKKRARLYAWDGKKTTPITDEWSAVSSLLVSEDGETAFVTWKRYEEVAPLGEEMYLLNTRTGKLKKALDGDEHALVNGALLNDGTLIGAILEVQPQGGPMNPSLCRLEKGALTTLEGSGKYNYYNIVGTDLSIGIRQTEFIARDGAVAFVCTLDESSQILRFDLASGKMTAVTQPTGAVQELVQTDNGYAMVAMRGDMPAEIYAVTKDGAEKQITYRNRAIASYARSTPEPLTVETARGEVRGFVIQPQGLEKGKKVPVILDIHGGPKTIYGSVLFHEMQYWASKGYAVIFCNPTGSDGRGAKFSDIRGKYGVNDYADIMDFVDGALKKFRFLDEKRMGVTGGSYGGFMTNWIIGHTDRFRAAASQRSIANWLGFYCVSDIGFSFARDEMEGTPWSDMKGLWQQSPLKYLDKATTPTLFIHSDEDYRCPLMEGLQMYGALRSLGVETKLCVFRGENHELSRSGRPKGRVRRLTEITEWMDKYLKK